ncbi:hypothetical protein PJL18_03482 [Paenarthrobacter nicotinovorans]|nr:hypothetical protein [Paenarthrobacter nicotinovorans]
MDHLVTGGKLDTGHAAGRASLRADVGGTEPQQLGLPGHEDEIDVVLLGGLHGENRVLVLQGDDLPILAVQRVVRLNALHHSLPRTDGQNRVQGDKRDERFSLEKRDEVLGRNASGQVGKPGDRRQHRHVHDLQAQHPPLRCHGTDFSTGSGLDHGAEHIVLDARTGFNQRLLVGGPCNLPGCAEQGPARVVRNLQGKGRCLPLGTRRGGQGRGNGGGYGLGFQEHSPPWGAVLFGDDAQLSRHEVAKQFVGGQDGFERLDFPAQFVLFLLQFKP